MAYCSKQDVENYLLTDISGLFDAQIDAWLASIKKYIDNYTDRTFEKVDETRKFDGSGSDELLVDDLISATSLKIDGNAVTTYYLYQDSNANKTPKNRIVLESGAFYPGIQNIEVAGSWGYSTAAPDDIKMVATKLLASIIKVGKDNNIQSFGEGDLTITYRSFNTVMDGDLSVRMILDTYKRPQRLTGYNVSRV
jgi:hypothetical protein